MKIRKYKLETGSMAKVYVINTFFYYLLLYIEIDIWKIFIYHFSWVGLSTSYEHMVKAL